MFDRRIGKLVDTTSPFDMVDAVIERYVYDDASGVASLAGGNVVLDFVDLDGDGQAPMELTARYLYGAVVDQILAKEDLAEALQDPERVLWHLADHLGTTRDLVDHEGALVEHYEYDSFGNVVSGDTSLTRYLFTGREWDADVDLQYSRARWYDPSLGRWISEDPIGFAAGDVNLARYVGNSPVSRSDPSGLEEANLPYSADPMDTVSDTVLPENVNYPPNPYSTDGTWWAFAGGFVRGLFSRENASTAVGSLPLVGTAQSGVEVVTGYDYIGRTPVDRRVAAAGIILGMVPGGKTAAKTGAKVGNKVLGNSADASARLVGRAPRGTLRSRMGDPPPGMVKPQAHHDLPQAPRFQKHWDRTGLDIDDPAFGRWVEGGPVGDHQKWSAAFNREWDTFFGANPMATREQILEYLKTLRNNPRFQ